MFRFVAPAGAPLEVVGILGALKAGYLRNGRAEECFESLATKFHVRKVMGASSGRAALSLILKALHRLRPERSVVAVPAYTCFTVAASIVRAGLRMYPLEISPETLDFEPSQLAALPPERLLCLVTSNLFGFVNDVVRVREVVRRTNAFVVDDAAQALGATLRGQPAGMLGDVGFYSFGRGKALAAMEGALIVTDSDEIAAAILEESQELPPGSVFHSTSLLFQMLFYSLFLNPRLYWFPNSLPFLELGATEFDPEFPEFQLPALVRELLPRLQERLGEFNEIRRRNAAALNEALKGNPSFAIPHPGEDCVPNYIRFPLIARGESEREHVLRRLQAAGIGAAPFYPSALCDIEGVGPHMAVEDFHRPGAEDLAHRLLTLPTHPYVQSKDLQTMMEVLLQG